MSSALDVLPPSPADGGGTCLETSASGVRRYGFPGADEFRDGVDVCISIMFIHTHIYIYMQQRAHNIDDKAYSI